MILPPTTMGSPPLLTTTLARVSAAGLALTVSIQLEVGRFHCAAERALFWAFSPED